MKNLSFTLFILSASIIINPLAHSFNCTSDDSGKPRCPAVSKTAQGYPAYNNECSSCATLSAAWYMWCNCPGSQQLMVTDWNSCINAGGYLSYINNTISCVTINSSGEGTIINPASFKVQASQNEFKAKNTTSRTNKTIKH